MGRTHLLLPFSYGVDAQAIQHVLRFARASQITLVALALTPLPQGKGITGPRLERIQQAQDFLEMLQEKAISIGVPLERHEIFTSDIPQQIVKSAQQLECHGILLMYSGTEAKFLQTDEANQLQQIDRLPLYILRMLHERKRPGIRRFLQKLA